MGCNQSVGIAPIDPVPQIASTAGPSAATPAPSAGPAPAASPSAASAASVPAASPSPAGAKKQTFAYRGKPLVVFVLGGPGCGKGTQCANIVRDYGFVHLSAGDLLRREEASGTSANAELIRTLIKEGKIVPVEITVALLKAEMELNVAQGRYLFLVDGFPRNENNEQGWHTVMAGYAEIAFCLFFDCSEEVMLERLAIRGKDSGRTDDNIESIKKRFRTFQQDTMPVVRRFEERGQLRTVSAMMSKHEVYDAVQKLFDAEVEARWKSKPLVAVVTGNSNTGLAALKALTTHFGTKVNARAIVRSQDKADQLRKAGLPFTAEAKQLVVGVQYTRPEAEPWPEALEGVSSLFIVAPNFTQNRADLANLVIDAARRNGVAHVAVLSVLGASEEKLLFQRQFNAIEKHAAESGVSFTALRAGYFMDNFIGSREGITQHHTIYGCTGDSKFSPVAVSDVGHAVAAVLADPIAHAGQVYNLTGPDLLSGEDFAKTFAAELGHEVAYQNQELLDFRAALVKTGWPEWQAGGLVELFAFIKNNPEAASTSNDVQKLTGQHTSFAAWVAANKEHFTKTAEEAAAGVRPLSPKPVQPANLQTTFAFIKPDVVAAGRDQEMLEQIKKRGFEVVMQKKFTLEKPQAALFYAEHVGKPFFEGLTDFMTSGPAIALALRKENAILDWRAALGPTNTEKAKETAPDSLRAQFGTDNTKNAGHGSDSPASAERELGIIFPELLLEQAKAAAASAFSFEEKKAPVQTTFAFIKPDVVAAGRDDEMLEQIKAKGFEVVGQKKITLERSVAEEFYGEHKGKPFFEGLVEFMTSGPAVALALRKENAILDWRAALGPTNTEKAKETAPDSLRAKFGTDGRQNAGHGSDSEASAARELKLVFPELNL